MIRGYVRVPTDIEIRSRLALSQVGNRRGKSAADPLKIVGTDALHQQEARVFVRSVGDQMRGFWDNVIALANGELAVSGGSPGFDRQCAFEHEVPIGHRTVVMPGDRLAGSEGEKARLHVAAEI